MTLHVISTRNLLRALKKADSFSVKAVLTPKTYARYHRECLIMGVSMEKMTAELIEKYCESWVPQDMNRASTKTGFWGEKTK